MNQINRLIMRYISRRDYQFFVVFSLILALVLIAVYQIPNFFRYLFILPIIGIYIYVLYLVVREILLQSQQIKNLDYFTLENYKHDLDQRKVIYKNLAQVLLGTFLFFPFMTIVFMPFSESNIIFSLIIILVIQGLLLTILLYIVLKFSGVISSTILISFTTFVGMIIGMQLIESMGSLINVLFDLNKNWLSSNFLFVATTITFSILIQVSISYTRPMYLLSNTKLAFQLISGFSLTVSLLSLIFIENISLLLYNFDPSLSAIENIKEELVNFFRILLFPYIVGAVFGLLSIEIRQYFTNKKVNELYSEIIEILHANPKDLTTDQKSHVQLKVKQCVYYGGMTYKHLLYSKREIWLFIKTEKN